MASCDQPGLMPVTEARRQLLEALECQQASETLPLAAAHGRVLSAPILAQVNVPPAANSAMDGYALKLADLKAGEPLEVSQRIPAGSHPEPLKPGTAARIFTGAEVPPGADIVVMQENTRREGEQVFIDETPKAGQNIRPCGQDMEAGQVVVAAGQRLDAIAMGVAASAGIAQVSVYQPLKVALLCTGDELLEPGMAPEPGKIYNSNRYLLHALLAEQGFEVLDLGQVEDTREATETALAAAAEQADVILTTGGVSVGEEDHIKAAISTLGELNLWKVNLKPGKPFAAARIGDTPLYGLPGNPGSALVTFVLLARGCLQKLQGLVPEILPELPVTAGFSRSKVRNRDEYLRANITADGVVTPARVQSSGTLFPLLGCDGFLLVPAGHAVTEGDQLTYIPFRGAFSG